MTDSAAQEIQEAAAPPARERSEMARTDEPLLLAHLERELRLIRRYSFVHSNLPFKSARVPILGPLLNGARGLLRGALSFAMGSQDEYNAAVAEVLLEFTRRAATRNPLTLHDSPLDEALGLLAAPSDSGAQRAALELLAREVLLLREQVRAAQLSAAESERSAAELLRRVAALEAKDGQAGERR